jgi:diguanylate cyclase (GGDEF)-like protein
MSRPRLPIVLLAFLPLVLGAVLVVVALAPVAPATASRPTDAALAAALASGVARSQAAVVASAMEGPVARLLRTGSSPVSTQERAQAVLDALAAELGGDGTRVVLMDPSGRTRLSVPRAGSGPDATLPAGDLDLRRVLGLQAGADVATVDEGQTVVFAVPVTSADGVPIGLIAATVPLARLLERGPASAGSPAGANAPAAEAAHAADDASVGATTPGSDAGSTITAPAVPGQPVPATLLLTLAAFSLLAAPLAWWAAGAPRRRAAVSAVPAVSTISSVYSRRSAPTSAPATSPPATSVTSASVPGTSAASTSTGSASPGRRWGRRIRAAGGGSDPVSRTVGGGSEGAETGTGATTTPPGELVDALSGLGNHRAYQEELDRLVAGFERNKVTFSLLLIDLDDLRITNERAGHAAGDEQLRTLGRQIRAMLRFSDRAFRIGGDEFAVLLPHTDAPGAVQLGQRLLAKVSAGVDGEPAITFSAGVADLPALAQTRGALQDAAAAALAWCKAHGRASVAAFEPGRHVVENDSGKAEQVAAVAQVIRDRTLRAVFQPIVDMATGAVVGFEGLTRPGPGAPFTNPGALFEAAEQVGRTVELDAACFATIAEAARSIPSDRVVSINLSPRTLEAADFSVEGVLATLASNDLDPGRVILELTERESVLDLDRLRDNLTGLQRAGVRIAADDVGAGNAGLRLLSQFRFDIVKVDLSLVQEGVANDGSRAVLRSLRDLAQRWGAFVIAEGIETPHQLKVVRELGLAAGQGFLIGRPGTIVDLPPIDLVGLERGELMLQNAPVPVVGSLAHGVPA